MSSYLSLLNLATQKELNIEEIATLLAPGNQEERVQLYKKAYEVKKAQVGTCVYLRGLIEFSNYCTCDCLYCGIRKSNTKVTRFILSKEEILSAAKLAWDFGYGSVVLQSGERCDKVNCNFVADIVKTIKTEFPSLGITLSCGQESFETYKKWKDAGADRYLLRIESTNLDIFNAIHTKETNFFERKKCLEDLYSLGYQLGSGVMIGLPGQSTLDLAKDIDFFRSMDLDMIGMGPYIPHPDTPMGKANPESHEETQRRFLQALDMIAVTRIVLKDVNIASTTALQAIDPENGRERGLLAGANVIMPNIGGLEHRKDYLLYSGKPGTDENAQTSREKLAKSIAAIGESCAFNIQGTPVHFEKRNQK